MKTPIIVIEDGFDVSFYDSPEIAGSYLEPIDILDNVYEIYDADACLLEAKICNEKLDKKWFDYFKPDYIDVVKIESGTVKIIHYDKLVKILTNFFHNTINLDVHDNLSLSDLIDVAKRKNYIKYE